jgi:hypothetical protein
MHRFLLLQEVNLSLVSQRKKGRMSGPFCIRLICYGFGRGVFGEDGGKIGNLKSGC